MAKIVEWLVRAMLAWTAVSPAAERARYEAIAADVAAVAYDPAEAPLFPGRAGRARTALLVSAIASFESSFRADVDDGSARGALGEACLMQVLLPPGRRIVLDGPTYSYSATEGWSYGDLIADRRKCVRAALHKVRESLHSCREGDRLSLYTSGRCLENEPKAAHRLARAEAWFRARPAPEDDALVATRSQ